MHGQQQNRFKCTEQTDVRGGREETLRTVIEEIAAVLVLHYRLNAENHGVPQRNDVQGNAFVNDRGSVEFVVAIHTQLLMFVFDYVIVDLRKRYSGFSS